MKKLLKNFFYKLDGIGRNEVLEKIENVNRNVLDLKMSNDNSKSEVNNNNLYMLDGCEYSSCAIPLDYPPSRELKPRWGYSRPVIKEIENWFNGFDDDYQVMLEYMKKLDYSNIPQRSSHNGQAAWIGGAISPFDAMCLYAMVMKNKPRNYIEIGSGMTTCFARQAVTDGHLDTKIISIDPQPRMEIEELCDDVFRFGLELFDVSKLGCLEAGDILFFDGSHRAFMNSDVSVFFIDILPKIKPGVIVHLHDICLPYDYPEMFTNWYWNEQYMLATCFLNGMDKIIPLLPTAYICRNEKFKKFFKEPFIDLGSENNLGWHGGGSMWFTYK